MDNRRLVRLVHKLSVIIPARNEYPQLIWTIYSIINDIPHNVPWEIIVSSNNPNEESENFDKWLGGCKWRRGKLTIIQNQEPLHPLKAIEHCLTEASGDILLHGCGHMVIQRGSIPAMLQLASREDVGYVHSPMLYLGDLTNPENTWKLYGYKDPLQRGWSFQRQSNKPYRWHSSGGGCSAVKLSDWHMIGGVKDVPFCDGIGGGETLLDMKMWMFGKSVWIHPDVLYYHYARGRGYTWKMHQYYWNHLCAHYILTGSRRWIKRQNSGFSYPQNSDVIDAVIHHCKAAREYVAENAEFTLQQVLENKPWLTESSSQEQLATLAAT